MRSTARAVALAGVVSGSRANSVGEDRVTVAGTSGKAKLVTKLDVVGDPLIYLNYKPIKFLDSHKTAPNWLRSFQVYGLNHSRFWRAVGRVPQAVYQFVSLSPEFVGSFEELQHPFVSLGFLGMQFH